MGNKASLLQIFSVFAKIGAFTIGGGYAILPVIQDEMSRRKWISDEELPDIIALAQSAPGLLTANISIFSGYKLRGIKGSIAATLGSVLPSFVIILLIAMVFTSYQDNPWVVKAFMGIRPVVVALILAPTVRMARKNCHTWWSWTIAIASLVAVAFLNVSAVYILIVVLATSFGICFYREKLK